VTDYVDTVIVGGGQAGLAVSYYLSQQGRAHVVLEQSERASNAWRNHRWDSFVLNTPNWQTRMPGAEYRGNDPDSFMSRKEVVSYLEQYVERFQLPMHYCIRVSEVEQNSRCQSYLVRTNRGTAICARPPETLPGLRDGFDQRVLLEIDLKSAGITNVIWATGYKFDFSLVKLPIFDSDGFPVQKRGVTDYPGLYFVGLPWLHNAKSGLIYGVGEDAGYIAQKIAGEERPISAADREDTPKDSWLSHDFCAA
jgi:cation diffusion facilitator CzcD-associated flavoprotein CzcO